MTSSSAGPALCAARCRSRDRSTAAASCAGSAFHRIRYGTANSSTLSLSVRADAVELVVYRDRDEEAAAAFRGTRGLVL